jgi:site-specific recombinase XerD
MQVTIYRRHTRTCPHFGTPRGKFDRCGCPYHADPRPFGKRVKLGTKDRATALKMARDMELGKLPTSAESDHPVTILEAKAEFLSSLSFGNKATETIRKHKTLMGQFESFATGEKLLYLRDVNPSAVARFAKTWEEGIKDKEGIEIKKKEGPLARGKKLERFRQFFKFCISRKWIEENPTAGMATPEVEDRESDPLEPNQVAKLLTEARAAIAEARSVDQKKNCIRMVALILLARYSGLRIGDCVSCRTEWVQGGRVRRIAKKNGAKIDIRLPAEVLQALADAEPMADHYWFWTKRCTLKTAVSKWQFRMLKLFRKAGIVNGHPHQFRHTFAVSLLEKGETLQTVADALGDTLEVVQKHYNGWSRDRQERQDDAVRSTWKNDPLLKTLNDVAAIEKLKGARVM